MRDAQKSFSTDLSKLLPSERPLAVHGSEARGFDLLSEALKGLTASPKRLDPKLFYDAAGSALFEEICKLPEYYLTRAELSILEERFEEISARLKHSRVLIDVGSGAGTKARLLLKALPKLGWYVPLDIEPECLERSTAALASAFPGLSVNPIRADFTASRLADLDIPGEAQDRLLFFPGSTIGNLEPEAVSGFLRNAREAMSPGGAFLLGIDLVKDRKELESAYNDSAGVTAAFNLNILKRLNSELGAAIDLSAFEHRAFFNEEKSRVEMHLVANRANQFMLGQRQISFAEGETVHTESSHKFEISRFEELARKSGWSLECAWTDSKQRFAVLFLLSSER